MAAIFVKFTKIREKKHEGLSNDFFSFLSKTFFRFKRRSVSRFNFLRKCVADFGHASRECDQIGVYSKGLA